MNKQIMIVGNYKWDMYEEALSDGFLKNNVNVLKYIVESWSLSNKLLNFRKLREINKEFVNTVIIKKPDALFFYRTNDIFPSSLRMIKENLPDVKIMIFHNDNPYIGFKNKLKYRLFLRCLKLADIVYVYRPSNILNAKNVGANNCKLLYPHFYSKNDLINNIDFEKKKYDVIFIGHYEENRAKSIAYLIDKGIDVRIFGSLSAWKISKEKFNWSEHVISPEVYGSEYKKTLSNAKLALCFLSRINHDVYTRRNFEIPATGTLTVSEYTDELTTIFEEDKEILLFKNNEELYTKISTILNSQKVLEEKTLAGYEKVKNGGHSEVDRAKQILNDLGWTS